MKRLLLLTLLLFSGCLNTGRVKNGPVSITPPVNASSPSSASVEVGAVETVIPAGAVKRVKETEATADSPATKETVYEFPVASVEREKSTKHTAIIANERAPDQTVALAKVEAAERRWLLFAAIGAGIAGIVIRSMMPAWPGISNGLLIGAAIAGVAWKVAALPVWIWLIPVAWMVAQAMGYGRADADKKSP